MSQSLLRARRWCALATRFCVVSGLVWSILLGTAQRSDAADVMRVEEDWELVLDAPSQGKESPQFETVMSPFGSLGSFYARVTWNYAELPDFTPGGLQIQAWNDESLLFKKTISSNKLSSVGETVSWTQMLKTDGTVLRFRIKNGQSLTWGSFGGSNLEIQGNANLANLNGYNPNVSVNNAGITFGANRVILLRVKAVRLYNATGNVLYSDNTSRVIHQR